jgi:hypothetical protein
LATNEKELASVRVRVAGARVQSDAQEGYVIVEESLDDQWTGVYRFEAGARGDVVLAEIRIVPSPRSESHRRRLKKYLRPPPREERPTPPAEDLTARVLRRLTPGGMRNFARDALLRSFGKEQLSKWRGFETAALEAPRRPGRKGHDDRFLAQVASVYVGALAAGSRRPIADTAERLREVGQHYSNARVRDLVFMARERGFLTGPPGPGRAGGELTAKAKAVLDEAKEKR